MTGRLDAIFDGLRFAPTSQIDPDIVAKMADWSDDTPALDILKVMDECVRYALCSDFAIAVLSAILTERMRVEEISFKDLVEKVTWRADGHVKIG